VLLMGSYQLLFLDRVPPHAAVAESVELLAASVSTQRYRGLANAVLRKVAAEGRASLANAEWQVRESMPQVVLEALSGSLPPEEWEAFAVASNSQAPLCIRVTRLGKESPEFRKRLANRQLRAAGEEVTLRSSSLAGEDCWLIEHGGFIPSQVAGFAEGWFTIEDEGAQVAALLAGAGQSGPLLDLCASPGGKTSHLADLIPTAERILATDLNDAKLERLRETLTRLGLTSRVETMLSRKVLGGGFAKAFGTVLVDAPCSGLGTLRRHPEIRYRFGKHGRSQVVQNQEQLLRDASRVVRPDGVLVYTVCTVNRAECEDQVQHFLATTPDFAPDSVGKKGLPFNPERLSCGPGMWRTWPHRHGCDGFFVARLRRKAD
jgi:16S rRNA (cytosine967-C5)-methyltransferase